MVVSAAKNVVKKTSINHAISASYLALRTITRDSKQSPWESFWAQKTKGTNKNKKGSKQVILGGGNSNILYFHPENWGRFPFGRASFSKGFLIPPTRIEMEHNGALLWISLALDYCRVFRCHSAEAKAYFA